MRIVNFPASIAVLLLAAIFFFGTFAELYSSPVSSQQEFRYSNNSKEFNSNQEISMEIESNLLINRTTRNLHPWMTTEQAERLLLIEGGENKLPVECCPSMTEMTTPDGARNVEGNFVQLYKDGNQRQQFYETSCKPEILNQPCRFMDRKFHSRSQCVQKYSFSYAIVIQSDDVGYNPHKHQQKQFSPIFNNQSDTYRLDYIQIRSGCTCEVTNRKRASRRKRKRKPE